MHFRSKGENFWGLKSGLQVAYRWLGHFRSKREVYSARKYASKRDNAITFRHYDKMLKYVKFGGQNRRKMQLFLKKCRIFLRM